MDIIAKRYLEDCKTRDECKRAEKRLIDELGEKEGNRIICYLSGYNQTGSSWECRDCAILDNEEYHDRLEQRYSKEG